MKATELRIGNWIEYMGQAIQVDAYEIGETELNTSVSQPIPLTEEWLVKFGFEKIDEWAFGELELKQYKNHKHFTEALYLIEVNYVHQLQNLYHSLTALELTIKQPA